MACGGDNMSLFHIGGDQLIVKYLQIYFNGSEYSSICEKGTRSKDLLVNKICDTIVWKLLLSYMS